MKFKPIEEGCLALIISGKEVGATVTVGSCLGSHYHTTPCIEHGERSLTGVRGADLWEVDMPIEWPVCCEYDRKYFNVIPEDELCRIDGYDEGQEQDGKEHDKSSENISFGSD